MGILSSKQNEAKQTDLFSFTHGVDIDQKLAHAEIKVQQAWIKAIAKIGILTESERNQVIDELNNALKLMDENQFSWKIEDEDIHMNLERFLTEKLGELGKKIHLGRSRNDLIATTLRIQSASDVDLVASRLKRLTEALLQQADKNVDLLVPGFTHLQAGQPVRMAHILLGHASALSRDFRKADRVRAESMEYMPLGSAALGGTTINIDLATLAQDLGFSSWGHNAYDAVSDRDYMLENLFWMGQIGVHLSRLAEDSIIWSSPAFQLLELPYKWSTGSSIMPNKRNPDIPELIRAKAARILSGTNQAQTLIKGLPTSYNTDFHELKKIYFETLELLIPCLEILVPFIEEANFSAQAAKHLLNQGHLLATDLANALTLQNVSFRQAYKIAAEATALASKKQVQIHELSAQDLSTIDSSVNWPKILPLDFETSVESKRLAGGTSRSQVRTLITHMVKQLNTH